MRKITGIFLIITLLCSLFTTSVAASDVTEISSIGIINITDVSDDYCASYIYPDKTYYFYAEDMGKEGLEFFLGIFNDENMIYVDSETIEPTDSLSLGSFSFATKDGINYSFSFSNKREVFVTVEDKAANKLCRGFFKLKSDSVYWDLCIFLEKLSYEKYGAPDEPATTPDSGEEQPPSQPDKPEKPEKPEDSRKNLIAVKDLKILYTCTLPLTDFDSWGVCSYVREGETEPVTVFYLSRYETAEKNVCTISEDISENNTVSFNHERALTMYPQSNTGDEFDTKDGSYVVNFDIQINVSKDMQAEKLTVTQQHINSSTTYTEVFESTDIEQSGQLPSALVDTKDNVNYTGDENIVLDFKKLYSEKIVTNNSYIGTAEWGLCSYYNEMSGTIQAFYFYFPNQDLYLLSGTKKLVVPYAGCTNSLGFGTHAIANGREVFDSDEYAFQLDLTFDEKGNISNRKIIKTSGGTHINISSYDIVGGSLQSVIDIKTESEDELLENEDDDTETDIESDAETDIESDAETDIESDAETDIETNADTQIVAGFLDVPKTHWAYDEIMDFAKRKIVLGYGNGYFGVSDSVTYEQVGLLIDRMLGYKAENTMSAPAVREDIIVTVVKALKIDVSDADESIIQQSFKDCESIKYENRKYIAKAIELGLVIGSDGKLFPESTLTRAEMIMLLSRAEKY